MNVKPLEECRNLEVEFEKSSTGKFKIYILCQNVHNPCTTTSYC